VFDRLADWATGEDSWDITASYRNYLASTFGKDAGEMIARGAPRGAGIDLDHLGEGKIAPGSTTITMLTEKRKMADAEKDWLKSMAGSAVGMGMNYAMGLRDMMNGDYLQGAIKFAPEAVKGAAEATQLGVHGFTDAKGVRLPITASAMDIALKAVGIDPAKEAEYSEAKGVSAGLTAMRTARSANITQHLVKATMQGNPADLQAWEQQAVEYQHDHPGMTSPLMDLGRTLQMSLRNQSLAKALGTPLGVNPRDVVGRGMTNFGNFGN
jgi:hypothetical protein